MVRVLLPYQWFINYLSNRNLISKAYLNNKSCLQVFVDSTIACVDNLVRDVVNMVKGVEDLKNSFLRHIWIIESETEVIKAISGSLSGYQTSMNDLSAKLNYLENQSRRSNVIIDGISNAKTFLGIIVDEKLNWKSHIEHVCKRSMKMLGILRNVCSLVHPSLL